MWNFLWFIMVAFPLIITGAFVVGIHNGLAKLRDEVLTSWSHLDEELGKKARLADNLVEVVKRYFDREDPTIKDVADAGSWLMYAETAPECADASNNLNRAVEDLFYALKNYPDLNSSKNFEDLRDQFGETEYLIDEHGHLYNEMVYVYNCKRRKFPRNIISNYFGFKDALFFNSNEVEESPNPDSNPDEKDVYAPQQGDQH